ncbi:MAG: hypothetical protein WB782_01635 [Thermoplasmata archaeon]
MPYKDPNAKLGWDKSHPERKHDRHLKTRQERRPTAYQFGRFVAVDGEGEEREDGSQDYAFLSDSLGRTVQSETHLSTVECLEFLLQIPEINGKSIVVGFGLNYDVSHWLRDLSKNQMARLFKYKSVYFGPHNIEWIPRKWFRVWRREGKRGYVRVQDILSNFNAPFIEVVQEWVHSDAATKLLEEGKKLRGSFTRAEREFSLRYNREELDLMVRIMERFKTARDNAGVRTSEFYSPAALGKDFLRQHHAKDFITDLPPEVEGVARRAFFGGRIEIAGFGRAHCKVFNYDETSSYPRGVADLPNFANGEWIHGRENLGIHSDNGARAIYKIRWDFRKVKRRFYPFPFRDKTSVFFPPCGTSWLWDVEVQSAVAYGDFEEAAIQVLDAWQFVPNDPSERPFAWIESLYELRRALKANGDPAEKVLKLAYNSIYGAFAQQIGLLRNKKPTYQNMAYAGLITASTRASLYAFIRRDENSVISIATDGVYSLEPLDGEEYFRRMKGRGRAASYHTRIDRGLTEAEWESIQNTTDPEAKAALFLSLDEAHVKAHESALGGMKASVFEDMTVIQSGVYRLKHPEKCACDLCQFGRTAGGWELHARGFGGKDAPFERIETAWKDRSRVFTWKSPRKCFVGPKAALARGDFHRRFVWEEKSREIQLNGLGTKRAAFPRPDRWDKLGIAPDLRIEWSRPEFIGFSPEMESAPYIGKQPPKDEEEIQEELMQEMEEDQ